MFISNLPPIFAVVAFFFASFSNKFCLFGTKRHDSCIEERVKRAENEQGCSRTNPYCKESEHVQSNRRCQRRTRSRPGRASALRLLPDGKPDYPPPQVRPRRSPSRFHIPL